MDVAPGTDNAAAGGARLQHKLRVLSYNIDTNIVRAEMGYARDTHPQWRANARAGLVAKALHQIIDAKRPAVVNIQECRQFEAGPGDFVDSVTPIAKALEEKHYQVLVQKYNEAGGDKAFRYITAYDPDKLTLKNSYMRYLTQTPDAPTPRPDTANMSEAQKRQAVDAVREHNFGPEWERGVFISEFSHVDVAAPVFSINVHLDVSERHRLKASELIAGFAREILEKAPTAKIVMTGDFNTFPDGGGPQQLDMLKSATFNGAQLFDEATKNLTLPNGEPAGSSFIAYPYDFIGVTASTFDDTFMARIESDEGRQQLAQALAKQGPGSFNVATVLMALEPAHRKNVMRLVFEKTMALGGILDRVFQHGFDDATTKARLRPAPTQPLPDDLSYNDEAQVKDFILQHDDNGPAFASDHQPVLTSLRLADL